MDMFPGGTRVCGRNVPQLAGKEFRSGLCTVSKCNNTILSALSTLISAQKQGRHLSKSAIKTWLVPLGKLGNGLKYALLILRFVSFSHGSPEFRYLSHAGYKHWLNNSLACSVP